MKAQFQVRQFRYAFLSQAQSSSAFSSGLSFELPSCAITVLVGPNGSGKSTLMKAVAGLLPLPPPHCSAQVEFQGEHFLNFSPEKRAQVVAYVPSEIHTEFPLTAYEVVSMGRLCWPVQRFWTQGSSEASLIAQAMQRAFCWELRDRDFSSLSGGEKQRVAIARALAQQSPVLFLDEALSQMDLNHQMQVGGLLRELAQNGASILWVCHDLNLALSWAQFGIFLKEGRLIAQGPLESSLQVSVLETLYPGVHFRLGRHPESGALQVFTAAR
ncbi:MAG: ABC transporter ATP-binding protein [Bdellovibrionia bacterium]